MKTLDRTFYNFYRSTKSILYSSALIHNYNKRCLIEKIEWELSVGVDINERRSKYQKDLKSKDPLLANFGIHHIHVDNLDSKKEDGPNLLMLFIDTYKRLYFINVVSHKFDVNTDVLDIMFNNFPHLFIPLKGIDPGRRCGWQSKDHKQLNSKGICTIYTNNTNCYLINKSYWMSSTSGLIGQKTSIQIEL